MPTFLQCTHHIVGAPVRAMAPERGFQDDLTVRCTPCLFQGARGLANVLGSECRTYVHCVPATQTAYAVCPTKLLEESDPLYAWRKKMLETFADVTGKAVGHPESL